MTPTYKIKEVVSRTGFTAPTLRYYEEIGLLPASARTEGGYRVYDDRTLERLAFIARAKHLGCTLEEIADLTTAWDGGRCGPIQDRLREVVRDKIAESQRQIVDLMTLTVELQRAAEALEHHRPDGACDDRCGCLADLSDDDVVPLPTAIALTAKPTPVAEPPIACTLGAASLKGRLDDWQALLVHLDQRATIDDGVRVQFGPSVPLDELMRLVAAEQECCQFFRFAITVDGRGVGLEVRAPVDTLPIVHSLFGPAE